MPPVGHNNILSVMVSKLGQEGVFKICERPLAHLICERGLANFEFCGLVGAWEGRGSGRGFWTDSVFEGVKADFSEPSARMRENRGCGGGQNEAKNVEFNAF